MSKFEIEWTAAHYENEDDPDFYNYAEGANVKLDGNPFLSLVPCVGLTTCESWREDEVYLEILKKLGYEVEIK